MDKYIFKNGKKLYYGYTTGSCATGAAKASTYMLFNDKSINSIKIDTPKGWVLDLKVVDVKRTDKYVSCAIVKDSGDDPDVTNKIKIYARAEKINNGVEVLGGKGIGKVTKPGLSVEVGNHAINPVPMKMIHEEIKKVLPKNEGVRIIISAPEGEKIAKKTFNPKLGIEGGISIIGTSGIVEPMSEDGLKDSISVEVSVKKEQGIDKLIYSPGNYGRDFSKKLNLDTNRLIKTSNYIGYMLDKAVQYSIKEILWIGHIGKMVKVAGGIFNTHSSVSDARMEILAANCALLGADKKLIEKIMNSITTEEAIDYIYEDKNGEVFNIIARKISHRCEQKVQNKVKVGTIIFSQKHGQLGTCNQSSLLLEEFKNA